MTFAALHSAIRERFNTLVATPNSMRAVWPNDPPTTITGRWCQAAIETSGMQQVSTGTPSSRRFRITGRVALNIYAPVADGESFLLTVIDSISSAFRGIKLGSPDITFLPPSPLGQAVRDEAGAHWRMPAQIPFRADVFGTASSQ